MASRANSKASGKLSSQFKSRLRRLGPREKVRAIVLLHAEAPQSGASRAGRQAVIDAIRDSSAPGLEEIERILARYGGEMLAKAVDALGSVPVEITVQGIRQLAASERVRAILEDQRISKLPTPKRVS